MGQEIAIGIGKLHSWTCVGYSELGRLISALSVRTKPLARRTLPRWWCRRP